MNEKKILIVDDEQSIRDVLKFNLKKEGYDVYEACNSDEALRKVDEIDPDLILLDVMIPTVDGYTVCRKVRKTKSCPIIFISAKVEVNEKIVGLEVGGDDYITKPFSIREVLARVKVNLRKRVDKDDAKKVNDDTAGFHIRDIYIDSKKYCATVRGKTVDLTVKEYELLYLLYSDPGKIFSRERILKYIWGYDYYGDSRTVDVTVRRLREKIELNTAFPKYIQTKRGMGYYVTL